MHVPRPPVREPVVWVCGLIAIVQVWILFSPPPKLIIWPDSIGYLGPALDALEKGYFSHWYGRGFVYAAWLWGLLTLTPDPAIIVAAQRVLVVVSFLCVAASMLLLSREFQSREPAARPMVALLAGFWLLIFALYPPVAGLAHIVMPEVLFSLLFAVVLAGLVVVAMPEVRRRGAAVATVVAVLASSALALVKPHWLFGAIAVPLVLPFVAPRERRRLVVWCVAAGLGASALAIGVPEVRLQEHYDAYTSRVFGPRTLFCNSGDLIHDYLSTHVRDPFDAEVNASLGRMLSPEARAKAVDWALLGFDGDVCMYGETATLVADHFKGQAQAEVGYYLGAYARAMAARPLYLVPRVTRQLRALAAKPFSAVGGDYFVRADNAALVRSLALHHIYQRWLDEDGPMFSGLVDLPNRRWLLGLRIFFAAGGLLLTTVTIVATVVAVTSWRRRRVTVPIVCFAGMAFCGLALNGLIAVVHNPEPRYIAMQMPLFTLAGFTASLVTLEGAFARARRMTS